VSGESHRTRNKNKQTKPNQTNPKMRPWSSLARTQSAGCSETAWERLATVRLTVSGFSNVETNKHFLPVPVTCIENPDTPKYLMCTSVVINSRSHPKSQFIHANHKKRRQNQKGHGAQYYTDSCCESKGALSLTLSSRPLVARPSGCRRSGVRTSAAALFTDMPFPNRKALSRGASEDDL
jgi:hypothetical protein